MNNDLVSIITPSFNTANYVIEAINSVVAQTYPYWEMIIVDDCSSDNSVEIVRAYIQKNKEYRIRLFVNSSNSGAAISRNIALKEAKGRWIAFLDSDDIWLPNKLENQIKFMEKNQYFFSYTEYEQIEDNSDISNARVSGPRHITRLGMRAYCWPGCLTVMYDKEKVGLLQIKDIKKNNDYAMWLKIIDITDCFLFPRVEGKYRKRQGSISNHSSLKLLKYHYQVFRVNQNYSPQLSIFFTMINVICGIYKKNRYSKKIFT